MKPITTIIKEKERSIIQALVYFASLAKVWQINWTTNAKAVIVLLIDRLLLARQSIQIDVRIETLCAIELINLTVITTAA